MWSLQYVLGSWTGNKKENMNVTIFWYIAPCSPYVNRRFKEHITPIFRVGILPVHADFLLGWFSTLNMDVILFSETSVHIRTARCCISRMTTFMTTAVRTSNPAKRKIHL
jgi:hypothetical protein